MVEAFDMLAKQHMRFMHPTSEFLGSDPISTYNFIFWSMCIMEDSWGELQLGVSFHPCRRPTLHSGFLAFICSIFIPR